MASMNHEWLVVLSELTEKAIPCALITVVDVKGSTPREAGTKMLVTATEQFGTIGGGNLEFEAVDAARKLLSKATAQIQRKDYALGPSLAQCCGGAVNVLLEPFLPIARTVYLFGAGHVGKEVVNVLDSLPLKVVWVDERAQEFPATLPKNCQKLHTSAPIEQIRNATEKDFIVVMTHSHDLDYKLVAAALKHGVFTYLGLIGSDTKRAKFEKKLLADGVSKSVLSRLTCPIGISSVMGKHPREIAIALAAEMLALGLTHSVREAA